MYDTIMMDEWHYTFAQTHRRHNIKSEHEDKLWTLDDDDVSM